MFLFWLLLAVHFPISVVVSDICVYGDDQKQLMPNSTGDMYKIGNACLTNRSLIEVSRIGFEIVCTCT